MQARTAVNASRIHRRSAIRTGVHTEPMGARRRVIALAIASLIMAPGLLFGETKSMTIRWAAVPGAGGYAVEWQGSTGVQQRKTTKSEVVLQLDAGTYQIRVSALNRFGKPASWSEWKSFSVVDTTQSQAIDLSRPEPPPVEKPPSKPILWKMAIPGWMQIENHHLHGWAYPSALLLVTAYGYDQKFRGDRIAMDRLNDPNFIVFVGITPASTSPLAAPSPSASLSQLLWMRRLEQRKLYDTAQRNQRLAGYAAVGIVALHVADLILFEDDRTAVIVQDGALAVRLRF